MVDWRRRNALPRALIAADKVVLPSNIIPTSPGQPRCLQAAIAGAAERAPVVVSMQADHCADTDHERAGISRHSLRPPEVVVRMACDQGFFFALDYRKGVEIW